ncbi:transcriptional regulator [Pullulanibacillus camelliae]|uniref:Transcriptional regulator n=1 Tax=Pullulanibacillus camelliae TaxID=1707096 RepID=A0A8J2YGN0_9BACL|nr:Crp/Fnr family transcriptional regulator [Pullulanibacillus camelliae]GGE36989.1 transcriptional regulator [Pullulanibacillus camelliae]
MEQALLYKGNTTFEPNTSGFEHLHLLKGWMHEKRYAKKSAIYCEGDVCEYLYYVIEGTVKLSKVTDDGKEFILQYFYPGDLFGEFNNDQETLTAFSAETLATCRIGRIKQSDILEHLPLDGVFAMDFSQWLSQSQRFIQLKLRDILFHGKNGALASTIIRAAHTYGIRSGNTIVISKKFTNYELANMIGATRETVNRMLVQLDKEGILHYANGRMTILNLEALKKICHCEGCPLSICRL